MLAGSISACQFGIAFSNSSDPLGIGPESEVVLKLVKKRRSKCFANRSTVSQKKNLEPTTSLSEVGCLAR